MHFIIITRCYKPVNIERIKYNIKYIFLDQKNHTYQHELLVDLTHGESPETFHQFVDDRTSIHFVTEKAKGDTYMYKNIDEVLDGINLDVALVYILDDDNLLHPDFLQCMNGYRDEDMVIFRFYKDGFMGVKKTILTQGGLGKADVANFVTRLPIIKKYRFYTEGNSYSSDGRFVDKLLADHCSIKFIDKELAYYNRLPRP